MEVSCANCGAKIPLQRDDALLICPYCSSTLYLDRARTFKKFILLPSVSSVQAEDLLKADLSSREILRPPLQKVEQLLMPYWGVRGESLQETIPAFTPVPSALAAYRLPSAGAQVYAEDAAPEYERVDCAESASASWEGRPDVSSFSQYMVPFYKITFGAGGVAFTAWVEGVSGRVYLDQAPPPMTAAITQKFWIVITFMFLLFTAEGLLVPGLGLSALVIAVTAVAVFPLVKGTLLGLEP